MEADALTRPQASWSAAPGAGLKILRTAHRGWPDSYLLTNGTVQAIVVPAIGRVMQFSNVAPAQPTFWENPSHRPTPEGWGNWGGDKCWPAPQSSWPMRQGRPWPPPPGFDASPMQAVVADNLLLLHSAIDPDWGIQVLRAIEIDPQLPRMHIRTEFHKLHGDAVEVAIWTVTQLRHPQRIAMKLRKQSTFAEGYVRLLDAPPADLLVTEDAVSLARHPGAYTKIGADSAAMAWVGASDILRIDVAPETGVYPDGGCLIQVYTNPDPLEYVELETLGPLATMRCGDRIGHSVTYTISPRSEDDPTIETEKALR